MKVWIDPDLCMGAGTCEQIAPDVFHAKGDGTWVVKEHGKHFGQETIFDRAGGLARVPDSQHQLVLDAAEDCPGECIFVEA